MAYFKEQNKFWEEKCHLTKRIRTFIQIGGKLIWRKKGKEWEKREELSDQRQQFSSKFEMVHLGQVVDLDEE